MIYGVNCVKLFSLFGYFCLRDVQKSVLIEGRATSMPPRWTVTALSTPFLYQLWEKDAFEYCSLFCFDACCSSASVAKKSKCYNGYPWIELLDGKTKAKDCPLHLLTLLLFRIIPDVQLIKCSHDSSQTHVIDNVKVNSTPLSWHFHLSHWT